MDFGALQREVNGYNALGGFNGSSSNLSGGNSHHGSVFDNYQMLDELGHGAYGTVMKAKRRKGGVGGGGGSSGIGGSGHGSHFSGGSSSMGGGSSSHHKSQSDFYAIKHIDKKKAGSKGLREVFGEVETMTLLTHPNIVHLEETFQDENNLWIVMEHVAGGELHKTLKRNGPLAEPQVRRVIMNLLLALDYIHQKGIVHRDLKPANCLLTEEGEQSLKIADFGFAVMVGSDSCLTSFCGTTAYMAPEIILDLNYGKPVDMWSVGVIVFLLLSGDYPFTASAGVELTECICEGRISFVDNPRWIDITPGAKDFIYKCLVIDPQKRMTAREALKHPWVKSVITMDLGNSGSEAEAAGEKRRKRNGKALFRGGVLAVMAAHRLLFLTKCMSLRREGADYPILMSFPFLVGRKFVATQNQLNCAGMFAGNPRAVLHLVPMVEACHSLELLDLSSNNIDSLDATQAVMKAVTHHPSLQSLILDGNPIPPLAGRALLRLARAPGKLKTISLNHTPIGSDVIQQIQTGLKDAERKRESTPASSPASGSGQRHGYGSSLQMSSGGGPGRNQYLGVVSNGFLSGSTSSHPGRSPTSSRLHGPSSSRADTSASSSSTTTTRLPPIPGASRDGISSSGYGIRRR